MITDKKSPNVLGRDILGKLRLNWETIFHSYVVTEHCISEKGSLNKIISEYESVFSDELGTLKNVEVEIPIQPNVNPNFFRASPVPYSLKDKIEKEIDRLVKLGIYQPLSSSKLPAPIVPVFKPDGSIRICGDYKQTVNKIASCDKYPVLKTEDIFAILHGGEKFTKLDLSRAYQQLLLSPKSRQLLTVNTHKGLFQPTCLQFGVHAASGIFQRELAENRLAAIPFVKVRSNDILIYSKNDKEHFENLSKVLEIIKINGLRLKLNKCAFMQDEVIYLGYKINKDGIFPVKEKIEAIKSAKKPTNVSELKSFLGLLNYYHRHFQNFADTLEPLRNCYERGLNGSGLRKNKFRLKKQNTFLVKQTF